MVFQNNILAGASGQAAGAFSADNSCRFNDDDAAKLYKTFSGAPTSDRIGTFAFWFKRGHISDAGTILSQTHPGSGSRDTIYVQLIAADTLHVAMETTAAQVILRATKRVFRDPTAWYHLVIAIDGTLTNSNCMRIYINGVELTDANGDFDTSSYASKNLASSTDLELGSGTNPWTIGVLARYTTGTYYDGYLSQFAYIDGSQLAASSFGEFDDYAIWRPIDLSTLTFGNNGYLLDFADSSTLGNDVSGKNNDFTSSGLAANDQTSDSPTDNYPTIHPQNIHASNTLKNGNRQVTATASGFFGFIAAVGFELGETAYWETTLTNNFRVNMGLAEGNLFDPIRLGTSVERSAATFTYAWRATSANTVSYGGADQSATVAATSDGDTIAIGVTSDGEVKLYIQNSLVYTYSQKLTTGFKYIPAWSINGFEDEDVTVNLGADDLTYSPPAGTAALNTSQRATPTILDGTAHFQTTLYTGNAVNRNISQTENSVFTPDMIWIKNRDQADQFKAVDAPRGVTKQMPIDHSAAQSSDLDGLQAFSDKLWIDASGETLIGNSTSAGGLAAAFDGDNSEGYATCAAAGSSPGTIGVDWGSGNTKTITQVLIVGSSDYGYSSAGRTINIKLEGSTDNFAASTVDLGGGTGDFTDVASTVGSHKLITPTSTTAYRYHRINITSSVGSTNVAQVQFFEDNTGDTRGFTLGNGPAGYNDSTEKFVAWQWKAGGGAGSSNEDGSINTTKTTVNTTAGISVGTYVGTGSAATVGHGLGAVPEVIIVRDTTLGNNWMVYHANNTAAPETDFLAADTTAATSDANVWNDTAPTSTVFSVSDSTTVASGSTFLYYAFAEIAGFSKFGKYEGNGVNEGPYIYCGFKPAWLWIKNFDTAQEWHLFDNKRSDAVGANVGTTAGREYFRSQSSAAEINTGENIDFLANGFKIRDNNIGTNQANTMIFFAFAEHPFGGEDVTPATAV